MAWRIRSTTRSDLDTLQAVEIDAGARFRTVGLESIATAEPPSLAILTHHVETGSAWTAEDGTGPVGFALAASVDGHGHLEQVSVTERCGGLGIGRALVTRSEQWARSHGFDEMTLTTFAEVPWNGPWYHRLDYRRLDDNELGPELAAIRRDERAAGLDILPRIAMRRRLT